MSSCVSSSSLHFLLHSKDTFTRFTADLSTFVLWQTLICLLSEVPFSWQRKYSTGIISNKLNFSISSHYVKLPCLPMQVVRIIIHSLHTMQNVVKSSGFQQAFQQVRHAFHSFFLNCLLEPDPKPIKGNIPIAVRSAVL